MQVKCEYCGGYISDKDERCPNCGAVNSQYNRSADNIPKTIEQLKDWYKVMKLPPEETTRFFIGKDTHAPKAFGIYQVGDVFVVYKNKSDGKRAIRYEGTDEAYAVNEIYMKLKDEILRQKAYNQKKKERASSTGEPSSYRRKAKAKSDVKVATFMVDFVMVISMVLFSMNIFLGTFRGSEKGSDIYGYHISKTSEEIVYYGGYSDDWWIYQDGNDDWEQLNEYVKTGKLPDDADKEAYTLTKVRSRLNMDVPDIIQSRTYIDAGNHQTPVSGYYYYNNNMYYYLNDYYGSYYDDGHSGWYTYDNDTSQWEYYCDGDDKSFLGDDMWYSAGTYAYDGTSTWDDKYYSWDGNSFEDTDWYQSAETYKQQYNDTYQVSYDSDSDSSSSWDWSSDSDYSWDSGSSWDSDWGSDWDSDW